MHIYFFDTTTNKTIKTSQSSVAGASNIRKLANLGLFLALWFLAFGAYGLSGYSESTGRRSFLLALDLPRRFAALVAMDSWDQQMKYSLPRNLIPIFHDLVRM